MQDNFNALFVFFREDQWWTIYFPFNEAVKDIASNWMTLEPQWFNVATGDKLIGLTRSEALSLSFV